MNLLRTILTAIALSLAVVAPASAQDFRKGYEALERGDFATALREWLPLAAQGEPASQYNVGLLYRKGHGVRKNATEAVRWFRLAAKNGLPDAQADLGLSYANGDGVSQDAAEAVRWYRLAAEQGNARAQSNLGVQYFEGKGVSKDNAEAVRWFRLAAKQGLDVAQKNLGYAYSAGEGVPQDLVKAYMWLSLSAAQGYESAKKLKDTVVVSMTGEQVAEALRKAEEERRRAEAARRAEEEKKRAEAERRAEEERRRAEAARRAEEERKRAEAARKAEEERRRAEAARKAEEERRRAEAARKAEEERRRKELLAPVLVRAGSSFTISQQGHLLTNQHVVDGCQLVTIHLPSGLKKARVVATDDTNDLALLKTDLEDNNFIPISGTDVSLLEDVIVAGYPLSFDLSSTVKVTKGVVSSLAGLGNDYSKIQIDAAVQKGNSGGPILNELGNVVAVTVSGLNKQYFLKEKGTIPENTNFGIKSMVARAFVDANGVRLAQPNSQAMSRRDMADLITQTTHRVGCWVSRATAQKMASGRKRELSVSPTMQRQVEALR